MRFTPYTHERPYCVNNRGDPAYYVRFDNRALLVGARPYRVYSVVGQCWDSPTIPCRDGLLCEPNIHRSNIELPQEHTDDCWHHWATHVVSEPLVGADGH